MVADELSAQIIEMQRGDTRFYFFGEHAERFGNQLGAFAHQP